MKPKNEAAQALGRIKSEAKSAASRENGKRGGRPKITAAARQRIMDHYDADKIRIANGRDVHVHTNRARGDGGPTPWWMFAGFLTDTEIQELL